MSQLSRRSVLLGLALVGALSTLLPYGVSSAAFTSYSANPSGVISAAPDWTPPTVAMALPDVIRGTYSVSATATDGETGVKQVVISRSPADAATWTTLCTATASPYACSFVSTAVADGYYDFQATATDNANYSATAVDSTLVDNTAPTAALGSIAATLSGIVTLTSTTNDAGSGIASVLYQYQLSGSSTWTTACTASVSPWTCQFDTTKVADGTYSFRASATDVAGNTTTTSTVTNKKIDNTVASVSVNPLPTYVRGTQTVTVNANSTAGVRTVTLEYQKVGTSTWTAVCTTSASPYGCSWNTTVVSDGDYLLRATLMDGAGKVTTSATVSTAVDNTPTRGYDVQATNGGALGKADANDTVTLTFTRAMNLSSIASGWTGTSQAVTLRIRDGGIMGGGAVDDTLDVLIGTASVKLGTVDLRGDYVKGGKTVNFNGTMVASPVTVNGVTATAVTLTFGAPLSGGTRTAGSTPVMVWTPSASALDLTGTACSISAITELGTADRDL